MSPMSTKPRRRHAAAPRYAGLTLVVPDGVTFQDWLTGEEVIRDRTERKVPVRTPLLRFPDPV